MRLVLKRVGLANHQLMSSWWLKESKKSPDDRVCCEGMKPSVRGKVISVRLLHSFHQCGKSHFYPSRSIMPQGLQRIV